MRVKELIKFLSTLDPEGIVVGFNGSDNGEHWEFTPELMEFKPMCWETDLIEKSKSSKIYVLG